MEYLVFRLYGAMASWGEIAVGESRHTANHPSKSALLGLVASALGIKRDEEQKQMQMAAGYHIAIKQLKSGDLLKDYHTTQAPDSVGKFQYATRRDELLLGKDRLHAILSSREYRTECVCIVAIKALTDAPFSLSEIQEKLKRPEFHLYLGRKSCPLSAPLAPQIIVTEQGCKKALDRYEMKTILPDLSNKGRDQYWLSLDELQQYYWEGDIGDFSKDIDQSLVQTFTRYDQPRSRKRWQFDSRLENFYQCSQAAKESV